MRAYHSLVRARELYDVRLPGLPAIVERRFSIISFVGFTLPAQVVWRIAVFEGSDCETAADSDSDRRTFRLWRTALPSPWGAAIVPGVSVP